MSLLQDLGAQLRATSDELPVGLVSVAMERLRSAAELLAWVRQTSVDPIGVPQLADATEHAERAAAALRVAQDAVAGYLATIGLAPDGGVPAAGADTQSVVVEPAAAGADNDRAPADDRLRPWWQRRVAELTGEAPPDDAEGAGADTAELLRRVVARVRSGDRSRLGRDLHDVDAAVGLGLSAVAPPLLHRLARDLLGHEPGRDDLPRLRDATAGPVRAMLPGTPAALVDTLLARICRVPPPAGEPGHPADTAVTGSVLTGVLLARLGRDPGTLDAALEPQRRHGSDG